MSGLQGADEKRVPDFRGAYINGKGINFLESDAKIACALNVLRFGSSSLQKLHENISGKSRKARFDHLVEHYAEYSKGIDPKTSQSLDPDAIATYFSWLNQAVPTTYNDQTSGKDSFLGLELLSIQSPNFTVADAVSQIEASLKSGVGIPVILVLDYYAVEDSGKGMAWEWQKRKWVVLFDIVEKTTSGFVGKLLDPAQGKAALASVLIANRNGNFQAKMKPEPRAEDAIDFRKDYLSLHGGDLDVWREESWAQRRATVLACAIVGRKP